MSNVELFLCGEMDAGVFRGLLKSSKDLQSEVNALLPEEAVNDRQHELWRCFSYDALKIVRFDLYAHICEICRLNGRIDDDLNLFGILKAFFRYRHPDFPFTTRYKDAFAFYLDVIQDCFDGPEVEAIVEQLTEKYLPVKPKSKRLKEAKEERNAIFHVEGSIRPHWIQGPEWPMGARSPMKYIKTKHKGETVRYFFQDVDTGEERIVEEYY